MLKTSLLTLLFTFLIIGATKAQDCTADAKANEAKRKLEEGMGQGCSYAAQFYAYLCECKNKPRTAEQAKMLKATLQKIKDFYNQSDKCSGMSSLPAIPNCKVGTKTGGNSASGLSEKEKRMAEFRQSMANARKIGGRLDAARQRAKRVSDELKQLSQISEAASPEQIMEQYNQNMQRMNQLERELRNDIATTNLNAGVDIINDYNSGNAEGSVYGTLGLLAQFHEDQQAKKEVAEQKGKLEKLKKQRMLSAALQMIKELREKRDQYLVYAATVLSETKEAYYHQLANYYNDYANYVNYGFSYSHTRWASYDKQPPSQPLLRANTRATAEQHAKAAQRKYNLYLKTKDKEFVEGAVQHMNAAINLSGRKSNYYILLSKYYAEINKSAALDAYLAATELNPRLKNDELYYELASGLVTEMLQNYTMFIPRYDDENVKKYGGISKKKYQDHFLGPKNYLTNLINNKSLTSSIILPSDLYGGVVFNSPLAALLFIDAKHGSNHWEHIGQAPKFSKNNELRMTRILQLCAENNHHAISTLVTLGANPEMKINGKDAIEVAIENGSLDFYKKSIKLVSNPDKYQAQYNKSAIPIIDNYINNSFDPSYINNIASAEQEEKVSFWLLDNFGTLAIINQTANILKIRNSKKDGTEPVLKGKGSDFGALKVVKEGSSPAIKNKFITMMTEQLAPKAFTLKNNSIENVGDYEFSTWLKHSGLTFDDLYFPPEEMLIDLTPEQKKLSNTLDSLGCKLCLEEVGFEEAVETIIAYLGSNKAESYERMGLNKYKTAYASYKETKKFEAEYFTPMVLHYYNTAAAKNGRPKIEMLQGRVVRPIDQKIETFAHLALLNNRYYTFKALSEMIPVAFMVNKNGESVIEYLQVMVVENPEEYIKYALLPGIKEHFDWNKKFQNNTVKDVIIKKKRFDLLADLGAEGLINQDLTAYVTEMADYGKFKEIAEMSKMGIIDITVPYNGKHGGTLLHALIRHVFFINVTIYKNDGYYFHSDREYLNVERVRERYGLDVYLALDLKVRNDNGWRPYGLFRSYYKQDDYTDKLEDSYFDEWKAVLK